MSKKLRSIPCSVCGVSPIPMSFVYNGYDTCPDCYKKQSGREYAGWLLELYRRMLSPIEW